MTQRSYPVFKDKKGNRFVFPGLYADETKSVDWGQCRAIDLALGVTEEADRLVVELDDEGAAIFEHVKAEAGSSGFAHGSSDVCLIGGPVFDGIKNEAETAQPKGSMA